MAVNYSQALRYAVYCKEVYQNFSTIAFGGVTETPTLISQADTQCAILRDGTGVTLVFRGSESNFDWQTNMDTQPERAEFDQRIIQGEIVNQREQVYPYQGESKSGALMHRGFVKAYFAVRDQIHAYIKSHEVASAVATGHSLGGALATLCAVDLQYNFANQIALLEAYTYGAPKVGNEGFKDSFNQRVPNSYRFVNGMDIVPELPRWWQGYRHVDQELRIGQRFSLNLVSARFKDHAIDQYIESLKALAR